MLNGGVDLGKIAASWTDESSHRTKDSDGDEFLKIMLPEKDGDQAEVDMSKSELTNCKQVALCRLLGHDNIREAFCALLDLPGHWGGLELGNLQRLLALRCDEVYQALYMDVQLILYRRLSDTSNTSSRYGTGLLLAEKICDALWTYRLWSHCRAESLA
jgi:hypothetical protein